MGLMEGKKTSPILARRQSQNCIPHRSQPCDFLPSVETTVFFRSLKIKGCYGVQQHTLRQVVWNHTQGNETFHGGVAENRMVGALRLGVLKKQLTRAKMSRLKILFRGLIGIKMAYFYSSRIFDEDGLARIEIGSGRRSDEGIAPHKSKKAPLLFRRDACLPSVCLPDWTKA